MVISNLISKSNGFDIFDNFVKLWKVCLLTFHLSSILSIQALLNLGSDDPNLRSVAYNLLYALTTTFNLRIEGQLLETSGLCIPANNTIFIVSISKTLAANEHHLTLEVNTHPPSPCLK